MIDCSNVPPFVSSAQYSDAEEIAELVNTAYKRDDCRGGDAPPRTTLEKVRDLFSNPNAIWYVVRSGEPKRILCTGLYTSHKVPETATTGNIHMLAAHPSVWGKKISRLLLDAMENQVKKDGQSQIRLVVLNTSPRLIKYYQSLGYRLTGKENAIPENRFRSECQGNGPDGKPKIFALLMEKDLI